MSVAKIELRAHRKAGALEDCQETMPDQTSYSHETVALDGQAFSQCEFQACRLVYSGGEPPTFENCRFDACEWKLDGPAARTLVHLRGVWNAGGKAPVQGLIKEITGAR